MDMEVLKAAEAVKMCSARRILQGAFTMSVGYMLGEAVGSMTR